MTEMSQLKMTKTFQQKKAGVKEGHAL